MRLVLALSVIAALAPVAAPPVAIVPFRWTPGQIEVAVRVNGIPATFLLDTGAEYSVVSSRIAGQLGLTKETRGSVAFADAVTLDMKGRVQAFAEPIGSGGSTASDGLIGNDLLARFTLFVDYPRQRLLLTSTAPR